jgi:hypothetical protein
MSELIRIEILFGRIEMESRWRAEGNRFIGEGRALHYDLQGRLTKDTGWQPTGVELISSYEKEPRRWWEFWK